MVSDASEPYLGLSCGLTSPQYFSYSIQSFFKNNFVELKKVSCDMAPLNLEQDETKTNFPELDSHSMLNMFIISLKHHNHPWGIIPSVKGRGLKLGNFFKVVQLGDGSLES